MQPVSGDQKAHVRTWRLDDLPHVARIEHLSFAHPWSEDMIARELENERARGLVVTLGTDPTVVGFGLYWLVLNEVHLLIVAVEPTHRRRGLGQRLMEEIECRGVEEGATLVDLEVRPSNRAAREMYRKLGFDEVGVRPRYYNNKEDAIILQRSIGAEPPTAA